MDSAGVSAQWGDILRDLNALTGTAITCNGKTFAVRSNAVGVVGVVGRIAQCVGVRLPDTVRQVVSGFEQPGGIGVPLIPDSE